jgi:hypothetical protein
MKMEGRPVDAFCFVPPIDQYLTSFSIDLLTFEPFLYLLILVSAILLR